MDYLATCSGLHRSSCTSEPARELCPSVSNSGYYSSVLRLGVGGDKKKSKAAQFCPPCTTVP